MRDCDDATAPTTDVTFVDQLGDAMCVP